MGLFGKWFAKKTPPPATPEELHNHLYRQGCDLIKPYMILHGSTSKSAQNILARRDLVRGIDFLKQVVQMNPGNWNAFWIMGKAHQALGASDIACEAFAGSYAIKKDNPDVAREYMYECLKLGKSREGLVLAEAALRLQPENAGLMANLALAQLIAGDVDAALVSVTEARKLDPNDRITQGVAKGITEVKAGKRPQPHKLGDIK